MSDLRRVGRVAGVLTGVAAGAGIWVGRPFGATILAAAFLVVLPLLSLAQTTPDFDVRSQREPLYVSSAVLLGLLGALAVLGLWGLEESPVWLFRPPTSAARLLLHTAVICGACLSIVYAFHRLSPRFGWSERDIVHDMMPETPREKWFFGLLSLSAGTGEEIAFRGFLPAYLAPWFGSYVTSALLPAVAFGLLHAYQGRHGILRTGLMGIMMAVGVAWSGSIWASMLAHTVLDLLLGLVLRDYFLHPHPQA